MERRKRKDVEEKEEGYKGEGHRGEKRKQVKEKEGRRGEGHRGRGGKGERGGGGGLPEDLGLQCLVKVPYKFHNHLRAVCKSWNAVLRSPIFYKERQRHEECEEGIAYFHQRGTPTDWEVIIY
ncbi:hypothetical protein SUGI_0105580 [Cryptomeria japonica]|nr:hypothetical protein SUGI_0105580 [Cryptomeria japonica]